MIDFRRIIDKRKEGLFMKVSQKVLFIVSIISAIITISLAVLHFFDFFNGNIDMMMLSLVITLLLSTLNQVNNYMGKKKLLEKK